MQFSNLCTPHPVNRGLDLGLHAADQFAVGVDEGLLGFDLGGDGALGGVREITNYELAITNWHRCALWWIFGWPK